VTSKAELDWKLEGSWPRPDRFGQIPADPLGSELRRARTARLILAANRARDENFSPGTFGDPAWEMLLILYLRECAGACSTMAGLLCAQEIPDSTASRWLDHLRQQGAVRRDYRPEVGVEAVELTARGRRSVERFLDALGAI
jgi:hypothetical protein